MAERFEGHIVCGTQQLPRYPYRRNPGWRITGIYGEPTSENKHKTWDYLRDLHGMINLPWVILGDYNEIFHSDEKEGVLLDPKDVCKAFGMRWKIATYLI